MRRISRSFPNETKGHTPAAIVNPKSKWRRDCDVSFFILVVLCSRSVTFLDHDLLQSSVAATTDRHRVLRVSFEYDCEHPVVHTMIADEGAVPEESDSQQSQGLDEDELLQTEF
jgi:hypothetical protein